MPAKKKWGEQNQEWFQAKKTNKNETVVISKIVK